MIYHNTKTNQSGGVEIKCPEDRAICGVTAMMDKAGRGETLNSKIFLVFLGPFFENFENFVLLKKFNLNFRGFDRNWIQMLSSLHP